MSNNNNNLYESEGEDASRDSSTESEEVEVLEIVSEYCSLNLVSSSSYPCQGEHLYVFSILWPSVATVVPIYREHLSLVPI